MIWFMRFQNVTDVPKILSNYIVKEEKDDV